MLPLLLLSTSPARIPSACLCFAPLLPCLSHTTMVKQLPVLTGTALKGRVLTACIAMVAGMGELRT